MMPFWSSRGTHASAARRAAVVYALLACLGLTRAIAKGATGPELLSGVIFFALGGALVGLVAWATTRGGRSRTRRDDS